MAQDGSASGFLYGVTLNPLDCNLDMILSNDRLSAHTLSEAGCGYCWSGVRANLGIFARGKFYFRVTIGSPRVVNVHNTEALSTAFGVRVGVSRFQTAVEQLGEVPSSWAFCSTGSRASFPWSAAGGGPHAEGPAGTAPSGYPVFEQDVGPQLAPGDTVAIALDLAPMPPAAPAQTAGEAGGASDQQQQQQQQQQGTLWMAVNDGEMVRLFSVPLPNHPTQSYFPHVLLRNVSITADFVGSQAPERQPQQPQPSDEPVPQRHQPLPPGLRAQGFEPWQAATLLTADCVSTMPSGQLPPASKCEVIVMTGLPGSGKTSWAVRHCAAHPARRYCVLGPQLVQEQMRLSCPRTRRFHYVGKPEEVFALVSDTLGRLMERAPATPRNYILDRTHVTPEARAAAVGPFREAGFRCVSAAVVVTEGALFAQQKEAFEREGKVVPDDVMARLRADFTLPSPEEGFEDVMYPQLAGMAAVAAVNKQRKEARAWLQWKLQCAQVQDEYGHMDGDVQQGRRQPEAEAEGAEHLAAAAADAARPAAAEAPPRQPSSGSAAAAQWMNGSGSGSAVGAAEKGAAAADGHGGDGGGGGSREGSLPPLPPDSPPLPTSAVGPPPLPDTAMSGHELSPPLPQPEAQGPVGQQPPQRPPPLHPSHMQHQQQHSQQHPQQQLAAGPDQLPPQPDFPPLVPPDGELPPPRVRQSGAQHPQPYMPQVQQPFHPQQQQQPQAIEMPSLFAPNAQQLPQPQALLPLQSHLLPPPPPQPALGPAQPPQRRISSGGSGALGGGGPFPNFVQLPQQQQQQRQQLLQQQPMLQPQQAPGSGQQMMLGSGAMGAGGFVPGGMQGPMSGPMLPGRMSGSGAMDMSGQGGSSGGGGGMGMGVPGGVQFGRGGGGMAMGGGVPAGQRLGGGGGFGPHPGGGDGMGMGMGMGSSMAGPGSMGMGIGPGPGMAMQGFGAMAGSGGMGMGMGLPGGGGAMGGGGPPGGMMGMGAAQGVGPGFGVPGGGGMGPALQGGMGSRMGTGGGGDGMGMGMGMGAQGGGMGPVGMQGPGGMGLGMGMQGPGGVAIGGAGAMGMGMGMQGPGPGGLPPVMQHMQQMQMMQQGFRPPGAGR